MGKLVLFSFRKRILVLWLWSVFLVGCGGKLESQLLEPHISQSEALATSEPIQTTSPPTVEVEQESPIQITPSPTFTKVTITSDSTSVTILLEPSCDDPGDVELLSNPWMLSSSGGSSAESPYQEIPDNLLADKDFLKIRIDLNASLFGEGERKDESAFVIEQPPGILKVRSVIFYKNEKGENINGKDGTQTIFIPLGDFEGLGEGGVPDNTRLELDKPAGPIHARFWNKYDFTVEIESIVVCNSQRGN